MAMDMRHQSALTKVVGLLVAILFLAPLSVRADPKNYVLPWILDEDWLSLPVGVQQAIPHRLALLMSDEGTNWPWYAAATNSASQWHFGSNTVSGKIVRWQLWPTQHLIGFAVGPNIDVWATHTANQRATWWANHKDALAAKRQKLLDALPPGTRAGMPICDHWRAFLADNNIVQTNGVPY